MKDYFAALAITAIVFWGLMFIIVTVSDAHPRDNCECQELRAIRRILEQQTGMVCNEFRCLPVPTATPDGGELP